MGGTNGIHRKVRVILVGVGGATCSGKTTLVKQLNRILPDSVIIHQDDFAPPLELVPVHPVYDVQDWDAAAGAITWPRLIEFLRHVKSTGVIPPDHCSYDNLNEHKEVRIEDEVRNHWIKTFEDLKKEQAATDGEKIVWVLVDGFLLYWHPEVIEQLDVRIMLRVPENVVKKRRQERLWYTAVPGMPSNSEGMLWLDPPHYWEQIVYPAYIDAHKDIFIDGDTEHGNPGNKVQDLVLLETLQLTMGEAVERCCQVILREAEAK